MSQPTETEQDYNFHKVLAADQLPEGEGREVRAGLKKIAIFRHEGEVYALQNFCPHAGGPLGLGEFSNGVVRCPRHSWGFDVKSGKCRTNTRYDARRYPTRVEDGYILVGVPDDGKLI